MIYQRNRDCDNVHSIQVKPHFIVAFNWRFFITFIVILLSNECLFLEKTMQSCEIDGLTVVYFRPQVNFNQRL